MLRIAAEQTDWTEIGTPDEFSQGLYVSVICNDYPQFWDIDAPIEARGAQFDASVADVRETDPDAFAPCTLDDWLASPWTEYESCIGWPAPDRFVPPVDSPATYPAVPTLVLVGDLDSITSAEGRVSSPTASCRLCIVWNYNEPLSPATVTGRVDGERVSITLPAP